MAEIHQFTVATVAEQSPDFRRVLWTGEHTQLVIMTIPPGGDIGQVTHEDTDQLLTFVRGSGEADVAGQTTQITQGDLVAVPAGTPHNFRNTGPNPWFSTPCTGPLRTPRARYTPPRRRPRPPRSPARTSHLAADCSLP